MDNMTVISKNPNYVGSELAPFALANLQTRIIPRGKLTLHEEVGEGAFGKVFKGEYSPVPEQNQHQKNTSSLTLQSSCSHGRRKYPCKDL